MKIVINRCYGGFGLSHGAMLRYFEIKGVDVYPEKNTWFWSYWLVPESERISSTVLEKWSTLSIEDRTEYNKQYREQTLSSSEISRDDEALVYVVEEMGESANGEHADLKVVEIPDGVQWQIEEYDGMEHIAEVHRTWS
jgi:hypothetical protein